MSHALRWPRNGNKFRRISRRQASQLPRWCDIPAASTPKKATPFFIPDPEITSGARTLASSPSLSAILSDEARELPI
jgi:hypothetical protein